jgi:hypothetical protein
VTGETLKNLKKAEYAEKALRELKLRATASVTGIQMQITK